MIERHEAKTCNTHGEKQKKKATMPSEARVKRESKEEAGGLIKHLGKSPERAVSHVLR